MNFSIFKCIKSTMRIIHDNIFNSDDDVICHQVNCVSTRPFGLSAQMFKKFPEANVYAMSSAKKIIIRVGTIIPIETTRPNGKPIVIINMAGQNYPSKPNKYESREQRLEWFRKCIVHLKAYLIERKIYNVSLPYNIGCGLAGGNWEDYSKAISELENNSNINVTLYRLD